MKRVVKRVALSALLVLLAWGTAGCGIAHLMIYPWAPREAKKDVKSEHDLVAERLLILPYAPHDVQFNNPGVGRDLSNHMIREIRENLRGRVHRVINPAQVALYQQSNLDWPNLSVAEIGRQFKADKVLYVELNRFTMMEEDSANLFRGRVEATIRVVAPAREAVSATLYEGQVAVTVPEDQPIGSIDISEAKFKQAVLYRTGQEIIWKFHDHSEKVVNE